MELSEYRGGTSTGGKYHVFNLHTRAHTALGHDASLNCGSRPKNGCKPPARPNPNLPFYFLHRFPEKETSPSLLSLLETFLSMPGPDHTTEGAAELRPCGRVPPPCRRRSSVPRERPRAAPPHLVLPHPVLQSDEMPRRAPWQPPREDADHLIFDII